MTTQTDFLPCRAKGAAPRPARTSARQPACACRRSASVNRHAPPHHAAANRSAQERILSNAGPLFQSGEEKQNAAIFRMLRRFRGEPHRCKARAASR